MNAHWLCNIFELLLAHVADIELDLAFYLFVGLFGKAARAGAGHRVNAIDNVDSIAIDIALVGDDVTNVDADAKLDPASFVNSSVTLSHDTLDFDCTTGCVDRARKFDQSTVTRGLDDTAAMFRDLGIHQFAAADLERSESTFLVNAHEAAVAGNIGREDGS